jgi:hypothetical protein
MRPLAVVVLLFPVLALLSQKEAVAGPPEAASGRLVLDVVGPGLERYYKEKDPENRLKLLERLAPTRDPRVAVLLAGFLEGPDFDIVLAIAALDVLGRHFVPSYRPGHDEVIVWWRDHKSDLRRRAAQLQR